MDETICYIGRKLCGCIVTVITDKPEHREDTAKELARWARKGFTIDRMTVKEVHEAKLGCKCEEPKKNRPAGKADLTRQL